MTTFNRQKFLRLSSGIGIILVALVLIGVFVYVKSHANDVNVTASVSIANTPPTAAVFNVQTVPAVVSGGIFTAGSPSSSDLPSGTFAPVAGDTTNTKLYIDGYVTDPDGAADIVQVAAVIKLNSDTSCASSGGGTELLADGGFESWSDSSTLTSPNWTATSVGGTSVSLTQDSSSHSGASAAKITGDMSTGPPSLIFLESNLSTGKPSGDSVSFSGYEKNDGGSAAVGGAFFLDSTVSGASSSTHIYNFTSHAWESILNTGPMSGTYSPVNNILGGTLTDYVQEGANSSSYSPLSGASLTIPANGSIEMVGLGYLASGAFTVYLDDFSMTVSSGGFGAKDMCIAQMSCTLGGPYYISGTSEQSNDRSFSCEIVVPYYAKPGTWQYAIVAWDNSESTADCPPFYDQQADPSPCKNTPDGTPIIFTGSSPTFTMASMAGLSGSPTLNYGTGLEKGSSTPNTGYASRATAFTQAGNVIEDVQVSSVADMVCQTGGSPNGKTIPIANQQFAKATNLGYDATVPNAGDGNTTMKELSSSPSTVSLAIPLTDVSTDPVGNTPGNIYWNILIPSDAKGSCSGTITASSIAH